MAFSQTQHEPEWILRAQQGDGEAFDRLVTLYAPRVINLATRYLGNTEDAQDVAQEAFLHAYDALARFRRDATFSTWLYRIVINVCHDELGRRRRRPMPVTALALEETEGWNDTRAGDDTTEDIVLCRERTQTLHALIAALPDPFRLTLVLYDLQGCSYQEIAELLHTRVGTVKSRLNRARNLLRAQLATRRELFDLEVSQNRA